MRAFAFVSLFALLITGWMVPDAHAQCYQGSYYYPSYYSAPIYYTQPTYYYPSTYYCPPTTYYVQPTTTYYTPSKKAAAPKVTESYYYDYEKKPGVGITETSSFDRPPVITESRSFGDYKPKVTPYKQPEPIEEKLPLKKIEMPKPDPEVKALKENVTALQESIRELKELVKQQQAELTKAKTAPVVVPEPKKVEAPSPMKKPSEFDKEPKK